MRPPLRRHHGPHVPRDEALGALQFLFDVDVVGEHRHAMLGDVAARTTDANKADDSTGRYILPFRNERNGRVFRYVRIYTVVTGSGSITYSAVLAPRVGQ
mgnify:CR=1 FL=1